jgi:predicted homoserine dehydrogenase-like protein
MVVGRAKKDLVKGSLIDNVGGYAFSGLAVNCKEMIGKEYVPIGLVENSKVVKDIKKDDIISFENIECNTDGIIYKLWDLQKLS